MARLEDQRSSLPSDQRLAARRHRAEDLDVAGGRSDRSLFDPARDSEVQFGFDGADAGELPRVLVPELLPFDGAVLRQPQFRRDPPEGRRAFTELLANIAMFGTPGTAEDIEAGVVGVAVGQGLDLQPQVR